MPPVHGKHGAGTGTPGVGKEKEKSDIFRKLNLTAICKQRSPQGLIHSHAEVRNEFSVEAIGVLPDGPVHFLLENSVGAFNHFFVSHHIVVKAGLNNIL